MYVCTYTYVVMGGAKVDYQAPEATHAQVGIQRYRLLILYNKADLRL